MKQKAEDSGGKLSRLAERACASRPSAIWPMPTPAVERFRRLAFELPPLGVCPAGRQVLAFEEVSFAWPDGRRVLDRLSFRMVGPRSGWP